MSSAHKAWEMRRLAALQDESDRAALSDLALEWAGGGESFWTTEEIEASLSRPEVIAYAAHASRQLGTVQPPWQGFLLAEVGPFSTDLLYIHVRRAARRTGLGRALLGQLLNEIRAMPQQEALFLEVRAGNLAAQRLYQELGLTPVGRRRRYYADGEDALVYKTEWRGSVP